jgi:hypothetical protein
MRRFEAFYKVLRGKNLGDPEFWNPRFEDLDLRLHARELDATRIDSAVDELIAVALQRLNDTFTPLILDAEQRLSNFGALFTGLSRSSVTIGLGSKSFVLTPETRQGYVFTDFVAARLIGDATKSMLGKVLSYDRVAGLLTIDVQLTSGAGTFSNWEIAVATAPDVSHSTRTDNPHNTTAAQVGAYTTAQVDAAINSLNTALTNALNAGLGGKANSTHSHAIADITGLAAALGGAPWQVLTDGTTIAWNVANGTTGRVTLGALGGNRTVGAPTGLVQGQSYTLLVRQDNTGGRVINTWDPIFKFPGDVPPILASGPNQVTLVPLHYDGATLRGTFLQYTG